MSQENVEIVRRGYGALQRRDVEEFVGYFDPDVEFRSLMQDAEGTFFGHDGVREWWAGLLATFPDWNPSLIEVRDLGDWVLIRVHGQGVATRSGIGVDEEFWQAMEFRGGRVIRHLVVRTEREALEAVGLSE